MFRALDGFTALVIIDIQRLCNNHVYELEDLITTLNSLPEVLVATAENKPKQPLRVEVQIDDDYFEFKYGTDIPEMFEYVNSRIKTRAFLTS